MSFSQTELPPIFEAIIKSIEDNNGKITTKEFKALLYSFRINREDVREIKKWLKSKGYIITIRECRNETITVTNNF